MTSLERLEKAWVQAGYPKEHMPRQQFAKVADAVWEAFQSGDAEFLKGGWVKAKVDFPFATSHPRYQAMIEAYRELGAQP
jgi:hypothetical protein